MWKQIKQIKVETKKENGEICIKKVNGVRIPSDSINLFDLGIEEIDEYQITIEKKVKTYKIVIMPDYPERDIMRCGYCLNALHTIVIKGETTNCYICGASLSGKIHWDKLGLENEQ